MRVISRRGDSGQITLPFVLLIGGIIVEVAIAGSVVTYFLNTSGFGERLSQRASATSRAGIYDAFARIARDKEFTSTSCDSPYSYSVPVGSDSATVSVCRTTDEAAERYVYTVTSLASSLTRQKKFVGTVLVNTTTGSLSFQSVSEEAIEE